MTSPLHQQDSWLQQMNAGKRCFQHGDLRGAARAFSRATKLQPERAESWVNLGSALLQSGLLDDAEEALKTALALNPRLMTTHMLLGDTRRMLGRSDESLRHYEQAVALDRSPAALNKLACALRARLQARDAEALYSEAIRRAPNFTLARVNLATLQLEAGKFTAAREQLQALQGAKLAPAEQAEVASARLALAECERLEGALTALVDSADTAPLRAALAELPRPLRRVDEAALAGVPQYLASARELANHPAVELQPLPAEWPWVEAAFAVGLASDVEQYRAARKTLSARGDRDERQQLWLNMESLLRAARHCREDMQAPLDAEVQLRHWHALACRGVDGYRPGHFKYTRNWSAESPLQKRVDPPLASATFQHFMAQHYLQLRPGLTRAAVLLMVLTDLLCFDDGNGRVALTWMNRELEWAGLMPALLPSELGLQGNMGQAMRAVRAQDGNLSPLLAVLTRGQAFARELCDELDGAG